MSNMVEITDKEKEKLDEYTFELVEAINELEFAKAKVAQIQAQRKKYMMSLAKKYKVALYNGEVIIDDKRLVPPEEAKMLMRKR